MTARAQRFEGSPLSAGAVSTAWSTADCTATPPPPPRALLERRLDPSRRCLRGTLIRRDPSRRFPPLQGVAAVPSVAAPTLFVLAARGAGQPKGASCSLPAPAGGWVLNRAILGTGGEVPMSQIAPAVATATARRLKRPAADRCGSIELMPATVGRRCDGTLDRRARAGGSLIPHQATAATGRSRRALATSNHSDMAAQ